MKGWLQKLNLLFIFLTISFATCSAACTASGTSLSFGTYTGVQVNSTSTVTTACPILTISYTVGLTAGVGSGATTTIRKMTGPGSATLSYQMFQNSNHTTNWGDTVGTDTESDSSLLGQATVATVYGALLAGQNVVPGTYTDTITIQVQSLYGLQTGVFNVSATISANCTLSANPLNFGSYGGAQVSVNTNLTVTCTNTTPYNVGLNAGTASGATVTTRKMTGPSSALLNYTLYSNSGLTNNWGNTVGTDTVAGTGTGSAQTLTVYGQIPAGQFVNPGSYTDTITATITY